MTTASLQAGCLAGGLVAVFGAPGTGANEKEGVSDDPFTLWDTSPLTDRFSALLQQSVVTSYQSPSRLCMNARAWSRNVQPLGCGRSWVVRRG